MQGEISFLSCWGQKAWGIDTELLVGFPGIPMVLMDYSQECFISRVQIQGFVFFFLISYFKNNSRLVSGYSSWTLFFLPLPSSKFLSCSFTLYRGALLLSAVQAVLTARTARLATRDLWKWFTDQCYGNLVQDDVQRRREMGMPALHCNLKVLPLLLLWLSFQMSPYCGLRPLYTQT